MASLAPASTLRAAIYIRVSKAEQMEGFSPEGMETRCRERAAALGLDIVTVFVEHGRGDDWELPRLWDMLRLAEGRGFDTLICFDTGRLARDMGKRLLPDDDLPEKMAAERILAHLELTGLELTRSPRPTRSGSHSTP